MEPDTSAANVKRTNLSSSNPSDDYSVWIGEWKWDQTTKYDLSTINIKCIKDQQISFSLNAFHVTNQTTMDGHNGDIDGIAVLKGNEAVYKDDEFKFELRMKLVDGHLEVKTNNSDMFGAYVIVDGLYNRIHMTIKNDYLIVPGKSVGKISLGMQKDDVIKLLGNPTNMNENEMTYKSKKNYIILYVQNLIVKQIEFTSPSFSTAKGINTSNFEDKHDHFNGSEFPWLFLQLRYDWDKGGLSFITFNADIADDNQEYKRSSHGYIYEGQQMYEEPITGAKWKPVSEAD